MKRILVPTDFSPCAEAAAEVALHLAKGSGAEIVFLHLALDDSGPSHVPGKPLQGSSSPPGSVKFKLNQLVKSAEEAGVVAKSELVIGTGSERVEDYIVPYEIDFLVMGSHGTTGIRSAIIGSKTQRVVRHVSVPTLVVKYKVKTPSFKHVVFASTFKTDTEKSLRQVVILTNMWEATLHMLFINMVYHLIDEDVAGLMMQKSIEPFGAVACTFNITETNDEEFGIAAFARQINADLIAVPLIPKSSLSKLFNPDFAEQLINHSELPVLVVRS